MPNGCARSIWRDRQSVTINLRGLPEVITAGARCTAMDPEARNAVLYGFSDGTVYMTENGGESFRKIVDGHPTRPEYYRQA